MWAKMDNYIAINFSWPKAVLLLDIYMGSCIVDSKSTLDQPLGNSSVAQIDNHLLSYSIYACAEKFMYMTGNYTANTTTVLNMIYVYQINIIYSLRCNDMYVYTNYSNC